MEEYYPLKLKRKDLEDVNDDFFDFSLSSPARKIRRLDAELPPIIEEEEEFEIPIGFEHTRLPDQRPRGGLPCGIRIEELLSTEDNVIVLFNPSTLHNRPSCFSLSVDPLLVSALKKQDMCSDRSISWRLADEEEAENNDSGSGNGCLAVVPWVSSKLPFEDVTEFPSQSDNSDMMDVQEVEEEEEEEMDVEDGETEQGNVNGMILTGGFRQWQQQQHCLIPQPPYNATAPILWYQ